MNHTNEPNLDYALNTIPGLDSNDILNEDIITSSKMITTLEAEKRAYKHHKKYNSYKKWEGRELGFLTSEIRRVKYLLCKQVKAALELEKKETVQT